jgi:hypothetical protein
MTAAPSALANGEDIFVFHQGYADNGQLWFTHTQDPLLWFGDMQAPNLSMSESPSAVLYNGQTYIFHQGGGNNGQLRYTVFDGTNWQPDTQIQPLDMSGSPSAVNWGGGIAVFHQGGHGTSGDGQLWWTYSTTGGGFWDPDKLVPVLALTDSPSAVVYNGLLYVFHQGGGNEGRLRYTVFNGTNWSADIPIQNVNMSGSPSAVVWDGGITVFHQGYADNGQLWYTYSPDGLQWGGDTLVKSNTGGTVGIKDSPAAVVF